MKHGGVTDNLFDRLYVFFALGSRTVTYFRCLLFEAKGWGQGKTERPQVVSQYFLWLLRSKGFSPAHDWRWTECTFELRIWRSSSGQTNLPPSYGLYSRTLSILPEASHFTFTLPFNFFSTSFLDGQRALFFYHDQPVFHIFPTFTVRRFASERVELIIRLWPEDKTTWRNISLRLPLPPVHTGLIRWKRGQMDNSNFHQHHQPILRSISWAYVAATSSSPQSWTLSPDSLPLCDFHGDNATRSSTFRNFQETKKGNYASVQVIQTYSYLRLQTLDPSSIFLL